MIITIIYFQNLSLMKSKINNISSIYSQKELQKTHTQMKALRYPVRPISNALPISVKLSLLNPGVKQKLQQNIEPSLNAYRQVRGDGNCFFRAFAFNYICSLQSVQVQKVFSFIDQIHLVTCDQKSIPKNFQPFYEDKLLKQVLKTYWQKQLKYFLEITNNNFRRALSKLFNENHYWDFIVILYFRAVCLYALQNNKEMFKDFLIGHQEGQLKVYGKQSQGVIINVLSKYLQMNIIIYEIRRDKDDINIYHYTNLRGMQKNVKSFMHLLFYDNHYDFFEENIDPQLEKDDIKQQQSSVYGEISIQSLIGQCIQCSKVCQISQENGLCKNCFNKNLAKLQQFKNNKFLTGFCLSCGKQKNDISQGSRICVNCQIVFSYWHTLSFNKFKQGLSRLNNEAKQQLQSRISNKPISNMQMSKIKNQQIGSKKSQQNHSQSEDIQIPSIKNRLISKFQINYQSNQPNNAYQKKSAQERPSTMKAQIFFKPNGNQNNNFITNNAQSKIYAKSTISSACSVCFMCNNRFEQNMLTNGYCRKCAGVMRTTRSKLN